MRASVLAFFKKYSIEHEGFTPFLYCDVLNLVTTGIGNLVDAGPNNPGPDSATRARLNNVVSPAAMAPALSLPWKRKASGWTTKNPLAGALVSQAEVADAWTLVKRQNETVPNFSQRGGFAYASLTNITLDMDGIETLVSQKMASNERTLKSHYPNWDSMPADAQMAMMSLAWAMGASFWPALVKNGTPVFQAFKDDIDRQDYASAAIHGQFAGGGLVSDPASRNHDNRIMFNNAAAVVKAGASPETLFFPGAGPSGTGGIAGLSNPGIVTPAHVAGGLIAAGLFGYAGYDWWKGRKS